MRRLLTRQVLERREEVSMSIDKELKGSIHETRPHRLKGAAHHLCEQAWGAVNESRKVIYHTLKLPEPKSLPFPASGPEQGILLQLLYEKYVGDEITSWSCEIWKAATLQAHPKYLEHLLLAATSYECANPRAASVLLDTYRDTEEFKERFLFHVDHFISAIALSPAGRVMYDGFTHLDLEKKPQAERAGRRKKAEKAD
ncbi:MAG: hypothetical protein PW734_12270 [Verrucomicrobium sp.]|nr:hypothetical protein [Verrucomicrobium sp.]